MNKGIIVVLLGILAVLIIASPQFTGFLTTFDQVIVSFSVSRTAKTCISILDMPETVVQYQPTSFMVSVENCGSTNLSGKLHFYVTNNVVGTSDHLEADIPTLNISEYVVIEENWVANVPGGSYNLSLRDDINGTTTAVVNSSREFEVISAFCIPGEYRCFGKMLRMCAIHGMGWIDVMICPIECIDGRCVGGAEGGGGPALPGEEEIIDYYLEYPEWVNINPGMTYAVIFEIENTGNVDLTNLELSMHSEDIRVETGTGNIPRLEPDDSALFMAEFEIPSEIEEGVYPVEWEMRGDRISESGNISVNVSTTGMRYKSEQLISYYGYLIDKVDEEISEAEEKGKNVDEAKNFSREARYELEVARELHRFGLYDEAIDQLDIVRGRIRESIVSLIRAKFLVREPAEERPPLDYEQLLLMTVISALIILAGIFIFIIARKRRSRKEDLLAPMRWEPSKKG